MFSWNWWYLASVCFVLGAVMLGYCRTHSLRMRRRVVQPRIERFGYWAYVMYAFCVSTILMVLLIVESLSGAMQLISSYLGKEKWTAMDFLLALIAFSEFSCVFGCALVMISRYFEEVGQPLYVTGEILMPKRGRLRLYNKTVAIPRGARRYWIRGKLDAEAVRQLLIMDTSCQDGAVRDDFIAKLYGRMPEFERKLLDAVIDCMEENARKEAYRRQAAETVKAIIRKNIPGIIGTTPVVAPEVTLMPEARDVAPVATEISVAPEKVQAIRELKSQKANHPFSIKGLTPEQTEMLVSYLDDAPWLSELMERSEVFFESSKITEDTLIDAFLRLAKILKMRATFFRDGSCGLRFIITKSGSVTIKSLGGAVAY